MIFKEKNKVVYTKDDYNKKFDTDNWYNDFENGSHYYKGYEIHRENGPAIEWNDGSKYWYKNGKKHREDGPACEWFDGDKFWYKNGKRHREDGPAEEYSDGIKCWYLNGIEYSEDEYNRIINIKRGKEILKNINL